MMRDAEKTIGNLIDKQRVSFIASISEDGFPLSLIHISEPTRPY